MDRLSPSCVPLTGGRAGLAGAARGCCGALAPHGGCVPSLPPLPSSPPRFRAGRSMAKLYFRCLGGLCGHSSAFPEAELPYFHLFLSSCVPPGSCQLQLPLRIAIEVYRCTRSYFRFILVVVKEFQQQKLLLSVQPVLCCSERVAGIHRETSVSFFLTGILAQRFSEYSGAKIVFQLLL